MGTPFKLKSGNASSFKNLGSSPVKQDVKQTITTGTSKNINTPGWKTTTVNTTGLPNQGRSAITTLDKTGEVVAESGGGGSSSSKPKAIKGRTSTLASGKKIPWDPTKRQVISKNFNMTGSSKAGKFAEVAKKSKVSKVVNLVKNKAKKVLNHPTTKKILKVGGKFGGAVFNIMPPPLVNPNTKYNKRQEG